MVCPHGDGGAAYTMQALWTMAREKLDVTTVIYANRSYAILNYELYRVGVDARSGESANSMLDLHNPGNELDADRQRSRRRSEPRHYAPKSSPRNMNRR